MLRSLALLILVFVVQFVIFEFGLRTFGSSEAGPSFQGLFENDPRIGHRLKPQARIRFTTPEFAVDIAINRQGVRDDEDLGAKPPGEKRTVLLGDSLVFAVQVPFGESFGELLEAKLNARANGVRHRVVNAGVQGYGPVEEALFFRQIAPRLEPDLVIAVVFVGNDAEEAWQTAHKLDGTAPSGRTDGAITALRRLVRRSMVLQLLRLRVVMATERWRPQLAPPEPPLQSYAARPAPRIAEGLVIARRCLEDIAATAAKVGARTAIALMPARFQIDDADHGRLKELVAQSGGELVRDAATRRFDEALASMAAPRVDLLTALRQAPPGPDLFYQGNVHLTSRGHQVVADALADFIERHGLLASEIEARR